METHSIDDILQFAYQTPEDYLHSAILTTLNKYVDIINDKALQNLIMILLNTANRLPHAHLLVILANEDKSVTSDDYDLIVYAELPNKDTQSRIFSTITFLWTRIQ